MLAKGRGADVLKFALTGACWQAEASRQIQSLQEELGAVKARVFVLTVAIKKTKLVGLPWLGSLEGKVPCNALGL